MEARTYLCVAWNGMSSSWPALRKVVAGLTPSSLLGRLGARERAAKGPEGRWILDLFFGGGELQRGGLCWSVRAAKGGCLVLVLFGLHGFYCEWQRLAGDWQASG